MTSFEKRSTKVINDSIKLVRKTEKQFTNNKKIAREEELIKISKQDTEVGKLLRNKKNRKLVAKELELIEKEMCK